MELFWHLSVCKQNLYLYKTELFELELFDTGALGNVEYPFIAITPRSTLRGSTWWGPIYALDRLILL